MKTRISALMDGELGRDEIAGALDALGRDGEARRQWSDGQLIGAALRGERWLDADVSARVMAALAEEPTVLAPRPAPPREERHRPLLALAASVAGVALVAWLALTPGGGGGPTQQLARVEAVKRAPPAGSPQSQATPRMQEYLVAHQAFAPGGPMVGGARNIRTVVASGPGR